MEQWKTMPDYFCYYSSCFNIIELFDIFLGNKIACTWAIFNGTQTRL